MMPTRSLSVTLIDPVAYRNSITASDADGEPAAGVDDAAPLVVVDVPDAPERPAADGVEAAR